MHLGSWSVFFNKLLAHFLKRPQLTALNFEVGHDGAAFVLGCYGFLLLVSNFVLAFFAVNISALDAPVLKRTFPAVVARPAISAAAAIQSNVNHVLLTPVLA